MSLSTSVQEYVENQPRIAWRRKAMRTFIRIVGFKILWRVEVTGGQNVPNSGPAIIMMNHISALDPILVMGAVTNRFVIPMTKIENTHNPLLRFLVNWWGSYTVNRGEVDRKALVNSIELVKSGQVILIAPEGHRHPEGLAEAKDGLAYVATKANAVIIPTAISGAVGWKEKMLGLQRPRINVNFGRPFRFKVNEAKRVPRDELAEMSHEAMYQLALAVKDETRRGFYSDVSKATSHHLEFVEF